MLLVGRRQPFLSSVKDAARIERHVKAFDAMGQEFRTHPGPRSRVNSVRAMSMLIPGRTFVIDTAVPPAEVERRLRGSVEPMKWFRRSRNHAPFEGVVEGSRFDVRRIIHHRNSFVPRVRGAIEATPIGTRVTGTMTIYPAVIALMVVWFGIVGVGAVIVLGELAAGSELPAVTLVPAAMLVLAGGMVIVGFVPETKKALKELERVVDASRAEWQ